MIQISMIIDQNYMEEYVIKPIQAKLKELEATMWLIKNDVKYLREEQKKQKEEEKEKKVK